MPLVICKKRFIFHKEGASPEERATSAGHHLTSVTNEPQTIPDWARQTRTFQVAAREGSLVEVSYTDSGALMMPIPLPAPKESEGEPSEPTLGLVAI